MKLLYTNENATLVWHARNLVEGTGIACLIRNEYASSGAGQLSPFDVWPELWVLDDASYEFATAVLQRALHSPAETAAWTCPRCAELNGGAFEVCWNCGCEAA